MESVVLLLAHGDREGETERSLLFMAEQLHTRCPGKRFEIAVLLPFPEPLYIEHVLQDLVKQGVVNIDVIPCFLFQGAHVRRDIPFIIDKVCHQNKGLHVHLQEPLGLDPLMLDLLVRRARMTIHGDNG